MSAYGASKLQDNPKDEWGQFLITQASMLQALEKKQLEDKRQNLKDNFVKVWKKEMETKIDSNARAEQKVKQEQKDEIKKWNESNQNWNLQKIKKR